jgi:integrase
MASVQERNGSFRVLFRHQGRQHAFTLGEVGRDEAEGKARSVEYLLMRLKQGLLTLPDGCSVVEFVEHDGKPPPRHEEQEAARPAPLTLGGLKTRFLAAHANGTLEADTLAVYGTLLGNVCRVLGDSTPLAAVDLPRLQGYVDARARDGTAAATIRKETTVLRAAWGWAAASGLVGGVMPARGLRYPKSDDKPPFMTLEEYRRQVAAGRDAGKLRESVYLRTEDVARLLEHVRLHAERPWVWPLFCFAAHTGARRSEMMRASPADVDLAQGVVTIAEKKRARGRRTTRRVPLTPFLKERLAAWLAVRPAGPFLFPGEGGAALTRKEVHYHVRRSLAGSEWEVLKGLHTLRHSFVSACASRGVDQRLVEAWVGHMDEETSRRYRHLWPDVQQEAIRRAFA